MSSEAITGTAAAKGTSLPRAYNRPAAPNAIQPITRAAWKARIDLAIALILASVLFAPFRLAAQDPPPNLAKLVAHRESETEAERNEYTYRQAVTLEELDSHGGARGHYRE